MSDRKESVPLEVICGALGHDMPDKTYCLVCKYTPMNQYNFLESKDIISMAQREDLIFVGGASRTPSVFSVHISIDSVKGSRLLDVASSIHKRFWNEGGVGSIEELMSHLKELFPDRKWELKSGSPWAAVLYEIRGVRGVRL